VKAVHGDVHALIDAGLLERTAANRVAFPFDAIRVEFNIARSLILGALTRTDRRSR
jgi:hypothetical protein